MMLNKFINFNFFTFESIFKYETIGTDRRIVIDTQIALIILGLALLLGAVLSFVYIYTHRKTGYQHSMPTTLIILPVVVATVLMLVGTNYASAFALAGVFTLVRFRSEPGDPKDISYIFASVAAGLCTGMGYVWYGILVVAVLSLILLTVYFTQFGEPKSTQLKLKILVPEDLNYEHAFDDIFINHKVKAHLDRVRTADFGTVYELVYRLEVSRNFSQKELIDELRTRNGNLNISLTLFDNYYTRSV